MAPGHLVHIQVRRMDGVGMIPKQIPIGKPKRKKTPKKNLEGVVVRACLKHLREDPDVEYVERRNTGAVQLQGGGFIRFGSKGAADIWCLVRVSGNRVFPAGMNHSPLEHVEVEVKRADGKGRLSKDQKVFQDMCNEKGIPYLVVTSVEQLIRTLHIIKYGIIPL